MGQGNSVPVADATTAVDEQPAGGPAMTLSPELEETILRDFTNQRIQNEWNEFRTELLKKNEERARKFQAWQEQTTAKSRAVAAAIQQRNEAIDGRLDALHNKFVDDAIEMEYNAKQLLEKYQGLLQTKREELLDSKPLPCLGPRAHWMDCQKKQGHFGACDNYLQILQQCVNDRIFEKSTQQSNSDSNSSGGAAQ